MGASDWTRVRQEARRYRAMVVGEGDSMGGAALLDTATRASGLRCRLRPPNDPLLSGAEAVLDPEADTIWVRDDLPPTVRHLVVAHELAHHWLHSHEGDEECACRSEDFEAAGGETLVGYGPRERREAEANVFAREFLLPVPLARRWFFEDRVAAEEVAARAGLPFSAALWQLTEALLPELPEPGELVSLQPPPPG